MNITVTTMIAAPVDAVWNVIEPIERHVEWMEDAVAIEFRSEQTRGVGTTFDCRTKIGPFSLTDRMVVTTWEPRHTMGIAHRGIVAGAGTFTLESLAQGTCFTWRETLVFPCWFGGPIGAWAARPALRAVWRRNLQRLRLLVEGP